MAAAAAEFDIAEDDVVIAKHDYLKSTWVVLTPSMKNKSGKKSKSLAQGRARQVQLGAHRCSPNDAHAAAAVANDNAAYAAKFCFELFC